MKQFLCFLLIIAMSVGLIACRNEKKKTVTRKKDKASSVTDTETQPTETDAPETQESSIPSKETTPPKKDETDPVFRLVYDHATFESQVSKRINLSDYIATEKVSGNTWTYTYIHRNTYIPPHKVTLPEKDSNFIVTIDNMEIKMPTTVEDLVSKGFRITEINFQKLFGDADLEQTYKDGTLLLLEYTNGHMLDVYVMNPIQNTPAKLKDCIAMQLSVSLYTGANRYPEGLNPLAPEMVYFEGITNHATLDDILSKLGAPKEITHSVSYNNGNPTLSGIQLLYCFEDGEYSGDVVFTVDLVTLPEINRANMVTCISYYIDIPRK